MHGKCTEPIKPAGTNSIIQDGVCIAQLDNYLLFANPRPICLAWLRFSETQSLTLSTPSVHPSPFDRKRTPLSLAATRQTPCNQIFVNLRNTAVFVVTVVVLRFGGLMEKWQPIVNNNRFCPGFWSLRLIPLYDSGAYFGYSTCTFHPRNNTARTQKG